MRDAVFRVSGGNPFYLSQLARLGVHQPVQRGDVRQVDTLTLGVPQSVMSMLAEEVRSLPPDSRRVLEAAAVAGEPFEPDVAAEIGEVSRRRGERARSTTCSRATSCARRTCRASSASATRSSAARSTPTPAAAGGSPRTAARRRRWRPAARRPAAQAHHVEHSARARRRGRRSRCCSRAAATAAPRAPATAARWLQAAVRLVPETDSHRASSGASSCLSGLAEAQRASGRLDACRTTLLQALELVAPDGLRGACGSSPPAPRSSTGSGATPRRARGSTPRSQRAGRRALGGRRRAARRARGRAPSHGDGDFEAAAARRRGATRSRRAGRRTSALGLGRAESDAHRRRARASSHLRRGDRDLARERTRRPDRPDACSARLRGAVPRARPAPPRPPRSRTRRSRRARGSGNPQYALVPARGGESPTRRRICSRASTPSAAGTRRGRATGARRERERGRRRSCAELGHRAGAPLVARRARALAPALSSS